MDLCFYFAAPIRRFAVLFLTSNMLVKRHSDFLALYFLAGVDVIGKLGMSYVAFSIVDTIEAYSIYPLVFVGCQTYLHVNIYFYVIQTYVFKRRPVA